MRKEKQLLLDELQGKIESHENFIITRYENLKANLANEFRGEVEELGGDFEIVRKRVFMKALEAKNICIDPKVFQGHVGVVFAGEDAVATTKAIFKFGKDNPDTLSVQGGRVDGTILDTERFKVLSQLPGKDEMRAQFLGLLEAPMAQTLAVVEALLTSVIHCLNNKIQLEEEK